MISTRYGISIALAAAGAIGVVEPTAIAQTATTSDVSLTSDRNERDLLCFQAGRPILAIGSVSDLEIERTSTGNRYTGLWAPSAFAPLEQFELNASADTTCFVTGARRGFFY